MHVSSSPRHLALVPLGSVEWTRKAALVLIAITIHNSNKGDLKLREKWRMSCRKIVFGRIILGLLSGATP